MLFEVRYTLYRENSSEVLSEGTVPVTTTDGPSAEKEVKAMFERPGTELILRGCRLVS